MVKVNFRISEIPLEATLQDVVGIFLESGGSSQENIKGASLASAPYSSSSKVATISYNGDQNQLPRALQYLDRKGMKMEVTFRSLPSFTARIDIEFLEMTTLYEPAAASLPAADIVAVHELGGHAFNSWEDYRQTMWLRDILPKCFSEARILTYGHDTKLSRSKSFASIRQLAQDFLGALVSTRAGIDAAKVRPVVFIGHGVGGLIIKEALRQAAAHKTEYADLLDASCGAVFFDVPNRGFEVDSMMSIVRGQPNEYLVADLSPKAQLPHYLHQGFSDFFVSRNFQTISCYATEESESYSPTGDGNYLDVDRPAMIVTEYSATYSLPNECRSSQYPIPKDHFEMVRFPHSFDQHYVFIIRKINDVLNSRISNNPPRKVV